MEKRLHEAAVPFDDFTKTLTESKQVDGKVVSNDNIYKIVSELNRKLRQKLIVSAPLGNRPLSWPGQLLHCM